jgi:mycothiol synthase
VSVLSVAPEDFPGIVERVIAIEDDARAADGHPSLGESVWRDLERPQADSRAFLDDGGFAHVARSDNFAPQHWVLGVTAIPGARTTDAIAALANAATAHVAANGGGRIAWWVLGANAEGPDPASAVGFTRARELYEMRVPLPRPEAPKWPAGVTVRPFEVDRDEQAWLEVNNRAFANHAEQGGWIEATLRRRMADAWFDPELFLLAFDADGLAGYNWLKLHDAHGRDPRLGEIFVIGVDPRMQGSGLGRALALAGLDAVHRRGVDTGMLFVAAENAGALHLYRSLGFDVHRVDRAYELDVTAIEAERT